MSARRFCRTPIALQLGDGAACDALGLPLPSSSTRLRTATRSWPAWSALDKVDPYFVELALRHELMHAEAFHYTRQTLGYPSDAPPRALVGEGDMALRGGVFRLGATRDAGFAFDNEKWSHPIVLEPPRLATAGDLRRVPQVSASRSIARTAGYGASTAGYRSPTTSRCGT